MELVMGSYSSEAGVDPLGAEHGLQFDLEQVARAAHHPRSREVGRPAEAAVLAHVDLGGAVLKDRGHHHKGRTLAARHEDIRPRPTPNCARPAATSSMARRNRPSSR